jgi:uncharacterized damage-inducible protein DinB
MTADLRALKARLATQLSALPRFLRGAAPESLDRRPASGQWSARENLAHLARHHAVFLERVRRILAEQEPALPRYRAEDDPEWPEWAALPSTEIAARLEALRAELVGLVEPLDDEALARCGIHPAFGPLTLAEWIEFFLLHEAHHLYVAMTRARG